MATRVERQPLRAYEIVNPQMRQEIANGRGLALPDQCPVCFEEPDDTDHVLYRINNCRHYICRTCLPRLDRCPICRGNFEGVRELHQPVAEQDRRIEDPDDIRTLQINEIFHALLRFQGNQAHIDLQYREIAMAREYQAAQDGIAREYRAASDQIARDYEATLDRIDREDLADRDRIVREYQVTLDQIAREYRATLDRIDREDPEDRDGIIRDYEATLDRIIIDHQATLDRIVRDYEATLDRIVREDLADRDRIVRDYQVTLDRTDLDDRDHTNFSAEPRHPAPPTVSPRTSWMEIVTIGGLYTGTLGAVIYGIMFSNPLLAVGGGLAFLILYLARRL